MTDDIKKLFKDLKPESLSDYERSVSRESLKLFMKEHPAEAPFGVRASDYFRSRFSSVQATHFMRLHPVALSLILVLGAGVGTSYAAEGAVPGEPLYPVKIHVNESVQAALAVSDEAKIDWSIKQVNRRLDEAEKLAYRGELTDDKRADIEARIEKSSENFDTAVLSLADTPDPAVVASAAADFETSLSNRERAFEKIAASPLASKDSVTPIIKRLKNKVEKAQRVRAVAVRFTEDHDGKTAASAQVNTKTLTQLKAEPIEAEVVRMQATMSASVEATTTEDSHEESSAATHMEIQSASLSVPEVEIKAELNFRAAILEAQEKDSDDENDH